MDTPIGPLMVFLQGTALNAEERDFLQHPAVGGVIFFSRNYNNREQLFNLIYEIKEVSPDLIFAVDHEGGRVQRFKEGFTRVPPMSLFGRLFEREPAQALDLIYATGRLMSAELREVGIHTGFSPVLDLLGGNEAIADRALHADPDVVVRLGRALIAGLRDGGLLPVGKHFPGHGTVKGDTHDAVVKDERPRARIEASDLRVFRDLISDGTLTAVMVAHVIYPQIDVLPAGLSERWLKDILRREIGFNGIVFSDDLAMQGIRSTEGASARRLLEAGCDMVLICRDLQLLQAALSELSDAEIVRYAAALGERWQQINQQPRTSAEDWDEDATREALRALVARFMNG